MPNPLLLYLFNEAASGTVPAAIRDTSSGAALNATITYGASAQWTSIGAGDGLNYAATGTSITGLLSGTKVNTALAGATSMTLEIVIDSSLSTATYDSYFQIVDGSSVSIIGLTVNHSQGGVIFSAAEGAFPNDCLLKYAIPTSGVLVLHFAIDSLQATPTNRVLMYVNGSPVSPTIIDQLGLGAVLDATFNWLTGNVTMGAVGASPSGVTYYAALYASTLSPSQVAANAAALAANNDQNPNASATAAVAWWRA